MHLENLLYGRRVKSRRTEGGILYFFLKRYTDTERTSPMKRTTNQNGKGKNGDGKINAISFSELCACPQSYLRNRSPDPGDLDKDEVEEFMEEFLHRFPDLRDLVPTSKVMRRIMRAAVADRKKRMAQIRRGQKTPVKFGKELDPVSL